MPRRSHRNLIYKAMFPPMLLRRTDSTYFGRKSTRVSSSVEAFVASVSNQFVKPWDTGADRYFPGSYGEINNVNSQQEQRDNVDAVHAAPRLERLENRTNTEELAAACYNQTVLCDSPRRVNSECR